MSGGILYLGSKISFILKVGICYEGILYIIDFNELIVVLVKGMWRYLFNIFLMNNCCR